MKKVIIINGTGGSGKDTFVEFVSKYAKVYNFSSIDKVKEVARVIGWDGGKTEKDRKFLSDLKKLTTEYNDMAFKSIINAVNYFMESDSEIMFIHIREPEEIQRVVDMFQAETLLIRRKGHETILSNESDARVEEYSYNYYYLNDTLEELDLQAQDFVRKLRRDYDNK